MTTFSNSPKPRTGALAGMHPFARPASVVVFHYRPNATTRTPASPAVQGAPAP